MLQRILDLLARFADAGKGTFRRIAAGGKYSEKFAAGNDVEAGTRFRKQLEDRAIRICLDRITNQMIQLSQRRIEPAVMIKNRPRAIYVERRPKLLRDTRKIGFLAMEAAIAVTKEMHA